MNLVMKLERKLNERSGNKDGREWKAATFLASTINTPETGYIVFDVMDGEKGRVAEIEQHCGKVCELEFGIEGKESSKEPGKWFNTVRLWRVKPL